MKTCLITRATLVMLAILCFQNHALARKIQDVGESLRERGYELTEPGMRKALNSADSSVVFDCLKYIEQEQLVGLGPDVKSLLAQTDADATVSESAKLRFVQCVLAVDKKLEATVLESYLKRIRRMLFEVAVGHDDYRGVPISAYNALMAANKYWHTDVFSDLMCLACSDIMKDGAKSFVVKDLFERYGDQITESHLDSLLAAAEDHPGRREYILRRAKEHGLRLGAVSVSHQTEEDN
jgi:hypothetical protein